MEEKPLVAKVLPVAGESFQLEGHEAFLILPAAKVDGLVPWIWYAPTLPGLPGVEEKWMFEKFTAAGKSTSQPRRSSTLTAAMPIRG